MQSGKKTGNQATVADYMQACPREVRPILKRIRRIVRTAAPEAKEVIRYRMPAFKLDGVVIYFAGFENHVMAKPWNGWTGLRKRNVGADVEVFF